MSAGISQSSVTVHMTNRFLVCMLTCTPPTTGLLLGLTKDTGIMLCNDFFMQLTKKKISLDFEGQALYKCTLLIF